MKNIYSEMEEQAEEIANSIREEIRESKHGLLKIIRIELIPIAMGASLGGLGRATNEPWIPAIPLAMDAMWNASGYTTLRGMLSLVKYGIGVALPYADKIYQTITPLLEKL